MIWNTFRSMNYMNKKSLCVKTERENWSFSGGTKVKILPASYYRRLGTEARSSPCCLFHAGFLRGFLILKMEVTFSSETSDDFQRTTRRYIPEYRTLHNHRCESLKSYITFRIVYYWKRFWWYLIIIYQRNGRNKNCTYYIVTCMGSVTNNCGFRIGWLDFISSSITTSLNYTYS
jgi:hypothetical protein